MKRIIRKTVSILLVIFSVTVLFNSCKDEANILPDEANLNIVVFDDLGAQVNGAKIYIFDSQQSYEDFLVTKNTSLVKDSAVSTTTAVTFKLEAAKEHWVLINYFDAARTLMLSNTGSNKIDKLEKSSIIDSKMYIGPVVGNVSFWSTNTNKAPIDITFNSISGTLPGFIAAAPTGPGDPNALNFPMSAGVYSYYAYASNGCAWAGSVTVANGGFYPIELKPCIRGRVTFIAPSYNATHGPISIVLDVNDNIGTLTGTGSYTCAGTGGSEPGTGTGSFVTITRDFNTYNYVARTLDGACVWTGSFTISADGCNVITLPTCP